MTSTIMLLGKILVAVDELVDENKIIMRNFSGTVLNRTLNIELRNGPHILYIKKPLRN